MVMRLTRNWQNKMKPISGKNMNKNLAFLLCISLLVLSANIRARDYFVSSSSGDDSNSGMEEGSPFASIEKLNSLKIKPGDKILFKSGDRFEGMLQISTQGNQGNPIVISRYGEGSYPVLEGNGEEAVIRMRNAFYIRVEQLKITNRKGKFGIYFTAESAGEMNELVFQDLDIFNVGFESMKKTNPSKSIGGLVGRIMKGNKPSWWNSLAIKNVYIHNVGSCGISFGGNVNLYKLEKDDPYYKPHQNVLIEQCRIDSIARDGIWIRQCEGAIIQHCEVSRTGMNAVSNGIWFWDCLNSVMQYNEGWECGSPRGNDGAPFSIDNHCLDCIIQYNYSHDNEGPGYMIFGREGDGYRNVIRKNLSYNDNVIKTYKTGTACIAIVSEVKDAIVEENVVIAGAETHNILGHRNWEGFPHSVSYRNNLFIGNGKAGIPEAKAVVNAGTFEGNLFINVAHLPEELKSQQDPLKYFEIMREMEDLQSHAGMRQKP